MPPVPSHLAPSATVEVHTEERVQLVDVSEPVAGVAAASGIADGVAHIWCPHTSCGLAVTEDEEGLHEDLLAVLEELAPQARRWAHDDLSRRYQNLVPGERPNGDSHIRGLLTTSPSITIPILGGQLALGRWQRLFVVELDGGRDRRLTVQCWGSPAAGATRGNGR